MPKKELLTLHEAADELEVSVERMRQFVYEGRLAAERLGFMWTVTRKELDRFKKLPRKTGNPGNREEEDAV